MKTIGSIIFLVSLIIFPQTAFTQPQLSPTPSTGWASVDTLLNHGKNESACDTLQVILDDAISRQDENDWTNALLCLVQIRVAMDQAETAALLMQESPWPVGANQQAPLNLYYGNCLHHYLKQNQYQIRKREATSSPNQQQLSNWSLLKLETEINNSFYLAWAAISDNSNTGFAELKPWLEAGTYPDRIQGTARDAVTYLWVRHLRNAAYWSPAHNEQRRTLSVADLLFPAPGSEVDLSSPLVHPQVKISQLLNSLSMFHTKAQRPEAALEAKLHLMAILNSDLKDKTRHTTIRNAMIKLAEKADPDLLWWSKLMWNLGIMQRDDKDPDNLIRAWEFFQKGARRHPDSRGGIMCLEELEKLQRPDYSLQAIDVASQVRNFKQSRRVPYTSDSRDDELINHSTPDLSWSQKIPDPLDYNYHQSYASLPQCDPGTYLVVTSLREDFQEQQNSRASFYITNSELVLRTYNDFEGLRLQAFSGETGEPLQGVKISVWIRNRSNSPGQEHQLVTDKAGSAFLPLDNHQIYQVYATYGSHSSFIRPQSYSPTFERKLTTSSFIYTDRPIHRPGQDLQWKAVIFESEVPGKKFRTITNKPVTITLYDSNNTIVSSVERRTNEFGSVSGTIKLPQNAPLGRWSLKSSFGGYRPLRVEEYKRPTFEVSLNAPEGETHLGDLVQINGEARYYFGQPVAGGEFTWVISRHARVPRHWRWGWYPTDSPALANGKGRLAPDGSFSIEFPAAEQPDMNKFGIELYSYDLSVQVVNQGGESKSVFRRFLIGKCAVDATVEAQNSQIFYEEKVHFDIRRTDLNKNPLSGTGHYRINQLQPPAVAVLPSDRPSALAGNSTSPYLTAGDMQQPRWADDEYYLQQISQWPENELVIEGFIDHGPDGWSSVPEFDLVPGSYRLTYETTDQNGAMVVVPHDFIVFGDQLNNLPFCLKVFSEEAAVNVGEMARFFVCSGLPDQKIQVKIFCHRKLIEERVIQAGTDPELIEFPVTEDMRGGIDIQAYTICDYQYFSDRLLLKVPWDNQKLDLEIVAMKDHLRCGDTETISLKVRCADGRPLDTRATELLAYMYDRSLDSLNSQHRPRPGNIFLQYPGSHASSHNLSHARHDNKGAFWKDTVFQAEPLIHSSLARWQFGVYARQGNLYAGVGGTRGVYDSTTDSILPVAPVYDVEAASYMVEVKSSKSIEALSDAKSSKQDSDTQVRQLLSETAFFIPHLQINKNGEAVFQFQVPQTVTDWNLEIHAMTNDLRYGYLKHNVTSSKDLLVRPYLPRFLREGDKAEVKVVLNNSTDEAMDCLVDFSITNEAGDEDITHMFGLQSHQCHGLKILVPAQGEASMMFELDVPSGIGLPTLKVVGRHKNISDGEKHVLPILPSRLYLQQSQFVALDGVDQHSLEFEQLNKNEDPTLVNEKLVVTIDAQLFQSTLAALPYLVSFPHECTEQTLNRYLSSSILSKIFEQHPEAESLAREFSKRETEFKPWQIDDPNRRILLEETPWLNLAQGGNLSPQLLINLLDPEIVREQEISGLKQLESLQTPSGGFPWFEGGRASPYLTLYVLQGFARGHEFGLEIPEKPTSLAWHFLSQTFLPGHLEVMKSDDSGWNLATYLVSILSSYPEKSWDFLISPSDRDELLDFSFRHWLKLSRMMKVHLSLALWRNDRPQDARMVMDSVMDLARTDENLGTCWPPEDRSWLWTRDTIESHALTLRALCEIYPQDPRAGDLAKWLLLNRKLNQWKSTRATAEAIYALAHFMQLNGTLVEPQQVAIKTCQGETELHFDPMEFSGMNNHLVLSPEDLKATGCGSVSFESQTPGIIFASATWHFSTEELPSQGEGDLLRLERRFFLRTRADSGWKLQPLEDGHQVHIGDQVEVQLSVHSQLPMEYIHLRDPRPAGFEPMEARSGFEWGMGMPHYREIRDNGVNYFIEYLNEGEFLLKHRLIANVAGVFRTGPAVLQGVYSPEFTAYSSGANIEIGR